MERIVFIRFKLNVQSAVPTFVQMSVGNLNIKNIDTIKNVLKTY